MADILGGQTDHSSFAPLSQAQTIAICQHLQQEIRGVEQQLTEVQRDVGHTNEHVQALRDKAVASSDDVHNLQVGLAVQEASLEKLAKEHARTGASVAELQVSDSASKDKLTVLDEAKKMSDTRQDAVNRTLLQATEERKALQAAIDEMVNKDFKELQKEFANMCLSLTQVTSEQAATAHFARQNRDSLRDARNDITECFNEVKRSNTVTNILENRLASTAKGVKQNFSKCSEIQDQMMKITECYEQTKYRVGDSESAIKAVSDANKATQHELEERTRELEALTDKVTQALKVLEDEQMSAAEMRQQLNAVRSSCEKSMRGIQQTQLELKELESTTSQVRAGLKEQSAMLLPNIHLDSPELASNSARHGSLLITGNSSSSNSRPMSGSLRTLGGGSLRGSPAKAWAGGFFTE